MGVMSPAPSQQNQRSAGRTRLLVSSGLLTGGLALSALYATTGLGLLCPFRALTGWQCPLCGGTRMGDALLHGDLAAAFAANPLALVAVVLLGPVAATGAIEWAGGPAIRPAGRVGRMVRRVPAAAWLVLAGVTAVAYTVLRNLG